MDHTVWYCKTYSCFEVTSCTERLNFINLMISRETDHVSATTFLFISKDFLIFWILVFETCFYELFIENIYHLTCSTNGFKGLFLTYMFFNTLSASKDNSNHLEALEIFLNQNTDEGERYIRCNDRKQCNLFMIILQLKIENPFKGQILKTGHIESD